MLSAVVRIESVNSDMILASLGPETARDLPRTHVSVHGENDCVVLSVEATDSSAMRAALNSYLECVRITEDIGKITGD